MSIHRHCSNQSSNFVSAHPNSKDWENDSCRERRIFTTAPFCQGRALKQHRRPGFLESAQHLVGGQDFSSTTFNLTRPTSMRHFYMKKKQDAGKDFAVGLGLRVTSTNAQLMYIHPKNISRTLPKRGNFRSCRV